MNFDPAQALRLARETLDIEAAAVLGLKDRLGDSFARALALILRASGRVVVMVVDDLVDSGRTFEVLRKMMPKAHFATIYAKPQGRPMVQTFITEVSQDTWIYFPWDIEPQFKQPIALIGKKD